ncbi:MAG: glycosyltransferase family 39 protein [Armatimonadota bacterium]|nr:MAG: glycosyltransferase family 39 protein [Armatimonadota bacterium]
MTASDQPSVSRRQWVRRSAIWLGSIVVFLFCAELTVRLRAAGVPWGLPNSQHYFSYHPDEVFLLLPAFGFADGDWNPHFFNYGTLYIYLVGIPAVLFDVVPEKSRFPDDLRALYEWGRMTSVCLGSATVLVLYLALRRFGRLVSWTSAFFLAICPLHVVHSSYATVDVAATFWLAVAFLFALYGAERPSLRRGAIAGMAVGLAAATKYNAGLFIVPAIVAPLLAPPRAWHRSWGLGVIGGALLGFVLGCPFFWTPEFARGVLFEMRHAARGGTLAFVDTGPGWWYHLTRGLPTGLGFPLLASVVIGAVAAVRTPDRPARLSLCWALFYVAVIGFGKERFIRYLVPVTPFLAVLAAAAIAWLYRLPKRLVVRVSAAALLVVVASLTFVYVLVQAPEAAGTDHRTDAVWKAVVTDPRDRAWDEVRAALEDRSAQRRVGLVQSPWYYHPPVSPWNSGPLFRDRFEAWNQEAGRIVVTGWDAARVTAEKPDFFFTCDLETADVLRLEKPEAVEVVEALWSTYAHQTVFERPPARHTWLFPNRESAPPDWLYRWPRVVLWSEPEG